MGQFNDAELPNLAIGSIAVWAPLALPALRVDLFQNDGTSKIIETWSSQLLQKTTSLLFSKKDSGTIFAYVLQDGLGEAQVADMKSWQRKSNMAKMAHAVLEREVAGLAFAGLARDTETRVEGAMSNGGSRVDGIFDIVQLPLGNFQDTLANYVLDRPGDTVVRNCSSARA